MIPSCKDAGLHTAQPTGVKGVKEDQPAHGCAGGVRREGWRLGHRGEGLVAEAVARSEAAALCDGGCNPM